MRPPTKKTLITKPTLLLVVVFFFISAIEFQNYSYCTEAFIVSTSHVINNNRQKALLPFSQKLSQPIQLPSFVPTKKNTKLNALKLNAFNLSNALNRRKIINVCKRFFFASSFSGLVSSSTTATPTITSNTLAEDAAVAVGNETVSSTATAGPIVEMHIKNIDGIPDQVGTIRIQLRPEWAPTGVKRFIELTKNAFWDDCRIFRVIPGFLAQFGINGNPSKQKLWRSTCISDDPVKASNVRGTVVFANGGGPNTRTTQIYINTNKDGNEFLDKHGFAPIGTVIDNGMEIVDRFFSGYTTDSNYPPNQCLLQSHGNAYIEKDYPKLTYISKASIIS